MQWFYVTLLVLLGIVSCHSEVAEDLEHFGNKLTEIPGFENLNQSSIPSVEDVQNAIKQKCEKSQNTDAFEKFGAATDDLGVCIKSNFNFTKIEEELIRSRRNGSMDEVFANYCRKIPVLQQCIRKVAIAIDPCLLEEEKYSLSLLLNITDSLTNFVCDKDGDRIAMFVADGGFECIQNKKEVLEACVNKSLRHHISPDLSVNNIPSFVITNDSCRDFKNLEECVVNTLETCEDDTSANLVGALFKYVLRITPCKHDLTSDFAVHQRFLRSTQGPNALNDVFHQVKQKYEPHCLKNGGQVAADKFRETLDQVNNCSNFMHFNLMLRVREVKGIPFEYLCNDFRLGIRGCLNTLSTKMGACSSPQEAYVPKFGIDLYDSLFNFYCKDDARALKKFLSEPDTCMNKIHNSTRFCLNQTKYIEVHSKDNVVTKSELCGDLKTLRSCFLDIAARQCSNNANTHEFVVGLGDAVFKPCSGVRLHVSNLLLFLLFLLNIIYKHNN